LSPDTVVSHLAARCPETLAVFQRFGIDCYGGNGKGLAQVCRERQLPYSAVLLALTAALSSTRREPDNWSARPLTDLTSHIVTTCHAPLRQELPRLEQMLLQLQGQGDSHRRVLIVLLQELARLRGDLEVHMDAEERELFPLIEHACRGDIGHDDWGRFTHLRSTVESQHDDTEQTLRIFRQITQSFRPPHEHGVIHELYRGLEELERMAGLHAEMEMTILFPRASQLVNGGGGS
jgi:regulator of cell morphogenesis and NO signaling